MKSGPCLLVALAVVVGGCIVGPTSGNGAAATERLSGLSAHASFDEPWNKSRASEAVLELGFELIPSDEFSVWSAPHPVENATEYIRVTPRDAPAWQFTYLIDFDDLRPLPASWNQSTIDAAWAPHSERFDELLRNFESRTGWSHAEVSIVPGVLDVGEEDDAS